MENKKPVDHHIFQGKWIARPSKPHPTVMATLVPLSEDHASFGHPFKNFPFKGVTIPMIADSGCQSSIIPIHTALMMGYSEDNLMPVTLKKGLSNPAAFLLNEDDIPC